MKIKVTGRRYSENATYCSWDSDKEYPSYEQVEAQTWEIEAATLHDGVRWLAENHPAYYMGANVSCENGDFACLAVPCGEYGKGNYETEAARIATARKEAKTWN